MYNILAQITNAALPESLQGASSESLLAKYVGVLWQTLIVVGGLAVIIEMLMAGFYWITAGGDKGKIETSKNRLTQSVIGLAILVSVAAISIFIGKALGLDLLRPTFPTLLEGAGRQNASREGSLSGGGSSSGRDLTGSDSSSSGSGGGSGGDTTGTPQNRDSHYCDRGNNIADGDYACQANENYIDGGICKKCVGDNPVARYTDISSSEKGNCPTMCNGIKGLNK
jgi:hypothetical protein